MEEFTTQDLIAELQAFHPPRPQFREGGLTIAAWAEAQNISEKSAAKELEIMQEEGTLFREWAQIKKHSLGWVYYKT